MIRFLTVLTLVSGCSVALQSKPKTAASDCSTTSAYWIADYVGVAAGIAAMAAAVVIRDRGDAAGYIGGAGAIGTIGYLASAENGRKWSRECRANQPSPIAIQD